MLLGEQVKTVRIATGNTDFKEHNSRLSQRWQLLVNISCTFPTNTISPVTKSPVMHLHW